MLSYFSSGFEPYFQLPYRYDLIKLTAYEGIHNFLVHFMQRFAVGRGPGECPGDGKRPERRKSR